MFLAAAASRGLGGDATSIGVIVAASSMFVAMIVAISMRMVVVMLMGAVVLDSSSSICMIGMYMAMFIQAGTNTLSLGSATRCTHGFVNVMFLVME